MLSCALPHCVPPPALTPSTTTPAPGPPPVLQVYKVAARAFLPKEWIMEQWDKGFYITAIAGRRFCF